MQSYPVKEKHIGKAVSKILWYTQTHRQISCHFIIRILVNVFKKVFYHFIFFLTFKLRFRVIKKFKFNMKKLNLKICYVHVQLYSAKRDLYAWILMRKVYMRRTRILDFIKDFGNC